MSRPKRSRRSTSDYLASAKKNAALIPKLKKYRKRKTLKPSEKGAITRAEKKLRGLYNLKLLTKKQAKLLKEVLPAPGVHALMLANTGEYVELHVTENKDLFVTTNGRTWVYWHLTQLGKKEYEQYLDEGYSEEEAQEFVADSNQETMKEAGEKAFIPSIREAFPIEKIIRLAEKAFKKPSVHMIGLWSDKGRVGEGFRTFDEFKQWVFKDYSSYANVEKWVNGIAILIAEKGEKIDQNVWSKRTVKQIEKDRKQRRVERQKTGLR